VSGFGFPFRIGGDGRTQGADAERHVRELIELVLFTDRGERLNRPDFGSDTRQLVFAGASPEIATAVEFLVQGALQRWLGDVLQVERLGVVTGDGRLAIDVVYRLVATDETGSVSVEREV
jgi:phage baseplate assembly protein W